MVAPVTAGATAAIELSRLLPSSSSLAATVLRVLFVAGASTAIVFAVDRAARRLLPLAALYRLSLVFPDHAPSRFRTALKAGSSRRVERLVAETRRHGLPNDASEAARRVVELITSIGDHDRRTRGHSERVRLYADLIGEELHLSKEDRQKLQWAALLHDLGKLSVPGEILNKKGAPTSDEWQILRTHPAAGERLVLPLRPFLGSWADAVGGHHEWWNGTGYPRRLHGDQISQSAAIVAVADAYEVMTAVRSYKKSMPASAARAELTRAAGVQFSPEVVRAFLCVSLGKLRWAAGPVASLAQIPYIGNAIRFPATVGTAIQGAGSVAAAAAPSVAAVMVATTAVAVSIAATPPLHSTHRATTVAYARTARTKAAGSAVTTTRTSNVAKHASHGSHTGASTSTTVGNSRSDPANGNGATTDSPADAPAVDPNAPTTDTTSPAPVDANPVVVSIGDVSIPEGDSGTRVMAFAVTLSRPADTAVTVQYTVTGGTATASDAASVKESANSKAAVNAKDDSGSQSDGGTKVNLKTGTLTFTPGSSGKTTIEKKINVNILGDTVVEPDETFNVTLSDPAGGILGRSVATGTILNDDGIASGVTVGIGDTSVVPSNARFIMLTVPVFLSAPATDPVSVGFTTSDGSATWSAQAKGGGDYGGDAQSGVLAFDPGTIVQYIQLKIWPGPAARPDRSFTISLTSSDGGTTIVRALGTVTIYGS
jgi:hypothetical protein